MPSVRISKELTSGIYYLTFTVRNWYYIFDRHNRFQILADSLKYCQKNKGVETISEGQAGKGVQNLHSHYYVNLK